MIFGPECSLLAFCNKSSLLSWFNRIDFHPQILYKFGMKVTPEIVRELLDYDPKTGVLTWRYRERKWFADQRAFSTWNARYSGNVAFASNDGQGYGRGQLMGKSLRAHRIAWAHHYGEWPSKNIDHINGNPADNRIHNLRDVSQSENNRNMRKRKDNTSGVCGVHWEPRRGVWEARINKGGRYKFIGAFDTRQDAIEARKKASEREGYSERHGT